MSSRFSASNVSRLLVPPILFRIAWHLRAPEWEYVADHWPKDDRRSTGWDDSSVVQVMRENWAAYQQAVDSTEPLAFWPWSAGTSNIHAHNVLMTWGYVLARAAHGKARLSVLDWGGALGNYAAAGKVLLREASLDFTVKERPALCEVGRELLPDVRFTSSDDDCFSRRYDLVMASNALQYTEDWQSMTRRLADAAQSWLFVTILPVVRKSRSFVVVQRPQRHGLKADYISWVLNYEEFLGHIRSLDFTLEREFLTGDSIRYRNGPGLSESLGLLFRRAS